jgi:C1A family cysteine protease
VLRDMGALPLSDYAFDPGWCGREPTPEQRARAGEYRIPGWQKLDASDLASVKGQLVDHRPVIFAMSVGPAFNSFRGDGVFDTFEFGAETTGHSMVLVGYDDTRGAFRLMNSFGPNWGDDGYAWISYKLWQKTVHVGFVIAVQ